jgi:hypothetical protein
MTAIGCALAIPLATYALARWSVDNLLSLSLLVALAGIVSAGAVHKVFHAFPGARWLLLAGLVIGGAAVVLTA